MNVCVIYFMVIVLQCFQLVFLLGLCTECKVVQFVCASFFGLFIGVLFYSLCI